MSKKSSSGCGSSVEKDGDLIDFVMRIWNKTASEPYYLLHFLLFFSYIPMRFSAAGVLSPSRSGTLLIREIQAVVAFCILTVIKLVREETWETFISNTMFFAKIFLAAIAFVMDYHLALWYTLAFLVIYLSAQQPPYEGVGDLYHLTPLQLETLLTEGNTSRFWLVWGLCKQLPPLLFLLEVPLTAAFLFFSLTWVWKGVGGRGVLLVVWFCFTIYLVQVEFRASSISSCIRTSSFFPELSITYSNKRLSFGTVDLGLFPNAAAKFGISLEVSSLSEVDFETYILSPSLTKKHLCRHFELDKLLLDYVNGK